MITEEVSYGIGVKSTTPSGVKRDKSDKILFEQADVDINSSAASAGSAIEKLCYWLGNKKHLIKDIKFALQKTVGTLTFSNIANSGLAGTVKIYTIPDGVDMNAVLDFWREDDDNIGDISDFTESSASLLTKKINYVNKTNDTSNLYANIVEPNILIGERDIIVIEILRVADNTFSSNSPHHLVTVTGVGHIA